MRYEPFLVALWIQAYAPVAVVVAEAVLTLAHVAPFLTCTESLTLRPARPVGVSRPVALTYLPSLRAVGATLSLVRVVASSGTVAVISVFQRTARFMPRRGTRPPMGRSLAA